jgi:hypothetical protein
MPPEPSPARSYLHTPWVLEAIAFFAVLWQEDVRLRLRTAHVQLPVPGALQRYYYLGFGDFANGFVNAFILDGLVDLLLGQRPRDAHADPPLLRPRVRAASAAVISAVSIAVFELRPSSFTVADALDIPAGLAGALAYFVVRVAALRLRREGVR